MAKNLRKAAQNRPCTIRLPGCDGGGETTVLAHYTGARFRGISQKPVDLCGAWACYNCHQVVDGAVRIDMDRDAIRLAHADACLETITLLVKEGLV